MSQYHHKAHRDDEGIDRIEIQLVPRFKTSPLSGDEWRVSARISFYRKGDFVGEERTGTMEAAAMALPWHFMRLPEISSFPLYRVTDAWCNQPGCDEAATVTYELLEEYSARGEGPLPPKHGAPYRRSFCDRHKRRGDGGLEDSDANYKETTQ